MRLANVHFDVKLDSRAAPKNTMSTPVFNKRIVNGAKTFEKMF